MRFHWATRLSVAGAGVSLLLLLVFYATQHPWAFTASVYFNYPGNRLGLYLFNNIWISDRGGPAPSILQIRLFDLFLVISSALQWFLLGAIIDYFWRKGPRSG